MYHRYLNIKSLLQKKSIFLFGPRSTGKTTLIKKELPNAKLYDLLNAKTYQLLLKNPLIISEENTSHSLVVIDEVQKLPSILDEVHRLIEEKKITFLLTGSSARKLKHGGANLLAGRAWAASLFPLTYNEISDFDLNRYINIGGLPQVYTSDYPEEELVSYVGTYLQEEIRAEAVTRNIQAFSEFLDIIALNNSEEINYESLASDCQVSPKTIKNYLQILDDTLLGFHLKSYSKTKRRKAITRPKYYLFDIGVTNFLANRSHLQPKSKEFGEVFEHFIILEVKAYLSYTRKRDTMSYWRSTSKMEVDLIVGDHTAIEIKATENIQTKHTKGLIALQEENIFQNYFIISQDNSIRILNNGIKVYPWEIFLNQLWDHKIL